MMVGTHGRPSHTSFPRKRESTCRKGPVRESGLCHTVVIHPFWYQQFSFSTYDSS